MGDWPRHQNKELNELLLLAEQHGWRVDKPKTYYRIRCPCGRHQRWVHLTPSSPRYGLDTRKWLERQPCWKDEGGAE